MLGVSNDAPAKNKTFKAKHEFPFDLLCDEDLTVAVAYHAAPDAGAGRANRISYLIGPGGVIKKAYAKVKAADHPEQVLGDL